MATSQEKHKLIQDIKNPPKVTYETYHRGDYTMCFRVEEIAPGRYRRTVVSHS